MKKRNAAMRSAGVGWGLLFGKSRGKGMGSPDRLYIELAHVLADLHTLTVSRPYIYFSNWIYLLYLSNCRQPLSSTSAFPLFLSRSSNSPLRRHAPRRQSVCDSRDLLSWNVLSSHLRHVTDRPS